MKNYSLFLLPIICFLTACNCQRPKSLYWETDKAWYKNSVSADSNFIDVFYIASTDVICSFDSAGNESFFASLTADERSAIKSELDFVSNLYYPDSVNMFAPYYHQYTMNAIYLQKEKYDSIASVVAKEVCEAFDYYMENFNNGRPFVLSGFSQGGQMVKAVLKHISDEQYSHLIAAYSIGFGVNSNDLQSPHIVPSTSDSDKGVIVSFNSVSDVDNIWPFVLDSSAICINPVNWKTSSQVASFSYNDAELSASIDSVNNVIVVKGFDAFDKLPFAEPWPKGNLHHYDLLFYSQMIKENTLFRSK